MGGVGVMLDWRTLITLVLLLTANVATARSVSRAWR